MSLRKAPLLCPLGGAAELCREHHEGGRHDRAERVSASGVEQQHQDGGAMNLAQCLKISMRQVGIEDCLHIEFESLARNWLLATDLQD